MTWESMFEFVVICSNIIIATQNQGNNPNFSFVLFGSLTNEELEIVMGGPWNWVVRKFISYNGVKSVKMFALLY